ncbi:F0F1 ATP synthase subunit A [Desulfoferrobacter suflitae]|uniref:F0F1 ATP synthase subunit A n=1 Tax=Desulfoferrobacter suflitae TaxID=2865782 RepID=UPI0021645D88|nr:F0F1 ATP synthase subunit A [Desulfoferrobacter suflitae]MCK8603830.1 F0F1 ATP synthase subunit A [Desulfoferrobacter suflitae]
MHITPDQIVFWQWHWASLNATIVVTWVVMIAMAFGAWLVTRELSSGMKLSRFQNLLEVIVVHAREQIRDVTRQDPGPYLPFIGTLFLFIAVANILTIVPGYQAPTGSLSTTAGLALCVFLAVPAYGIRKRGAAGYFKQYLKPSVFMLPFNVLGELSRTLALAVRLFGNVMSGTMIAAILLAIAPLIFPIVMQVLGLLTGLIQAYIFAILATVYIAAATKVQQKREGSEPDQQKGEISNG